MVKELEGYTLAFDFDEAGQLTELRGRGGVTLTMAPKEVLIGGETGRAGSSRRTSSPKRAISLRRDALKSVQFSHGEVRASAEHGIYGASKEQLTLTETPLLWNQRASLEAETIQIDVITGNLAAFEAFAPPRGPAAPREGRRCSLRGTMTSYHFVADQLDYRHVKILPFIRARPEVSKEIAESRLSKSAPPEQGRARSGRRRENGLATKSRREHAGINDGDRSKATAVSL